MAVKRRPLLHIETSVLGFCARAGSALWRSTARSGWTGCARAATRRKRSVSVTGCRWKNGCVRSASAVGSRTRRRSHEDSTVAHDKPGTEGRQP